MISRRLGLAGAGALLVSSGAPVRGQTAAEPFSIRTFRTRGGDNGALLFHPRDPAGPMAGATILLLHSSGGIRGDAQRFYPEILRWTGLGYRVVMPNYFSDAPRAAETDDTSWWRRAVVDAAEWTLGLPGVDPQRIGAMGFSRGGYLAGEVAVTTSAINAVVGVASAGNVTARNITRRPPVMLIHSDADPVIPPHRTRRWARILQRADVPVEVVVLDSPRHNFNAQEWTYIFNTADAFFRRTLVAR